ncbi:MAG: hypothetical protein AAF471_05595, partial [Myxococcota bacterium]
MDARLRGLPKTHWSRFSPASASFCHPFAKPQDKPECRGSDAKDPPTDRGFGFVTPAKALLLPTSSPKPAKACAKRFGVRRLDAAFPAAFTVKAVSSNRNP